MSNSVIPPSGYTLVDYIESTGTQYISTNFMPVSNLTYDIDFMQTELRNNGVYISGCYYNNQCYTPVAFHSTTNNILVAYANSGWINTSYSQELNVKTNIKTYLGNDRISCLVNNEEIYNSVETRSLNQTRNMLVFAYGYNNDNLVGYGFIGRIYKYIITNEVGEEVCNLVPCYRNSDNELGLYDIISDTFYTNQGTGTFTYGQEINMTNRDKELLLNGGATIPFRINIIDGEDTTELTEYDIINVTYEDFRYVDTDSLVIGQFVARKITGEISGIRSEFQIEDTELEIKMGIQNGTGESINWYSLGNFLVTKPTTNDVKDKTTFEALDYTKKFNQKFNPIDLTFPCTALDLAKYVCNQCGVELGDENFVNNDFIINDNQYTEGESCRKVMQDIGKLAYSWVRIDWNNKCYIDFLINNTIDEQNIITPNKYYTLEKQEKVFGPVNRVVVGMKDVEGENIYIEDADSIETYGVTELHIYDNNLTYTPELRQQVINAASRLFGISYIPLEISTTGHPWLQGNERIEIQDINGDDFYTYPFDRTIEYKGHIKTKLTSKADTKTETEYKNNGTFENEFRKTRIIVNKQTGDITSLTTKTNSIESSIQNIYTIDQVNELIQNAETGLTNTFSTSGGNNIFRNTGLWFSTTDQNNPYEFWNGVATRTSESRAMNGNAIVLQNTSFSQQQDVPNGTYTISFKYTKAIELSVAKVFINDVETTLPDTEGEFVSTINVSSSHINIRFTCDINGGCRIYDLMVNSGDVKLAYTQNQNETTTDTVNISKGITITSSDSDVTFKANVDGIRTLDRNNAELTTFTDKGMKTKEAIIQDTSRIVGILYQLVSEQTWLTKL